MPLYVDLSQYGARRPNEAVYAEAYRQQFEGNSAAMPNGGSVILDNLSHQDRQIDHVTWCLRHFERLIVTVQSDEYTSYFLGDSRLAKFKCFEIGQLRRASQERLIRRWMDASGRASEVTDQEVDHLESYVNTIIVDNKVFPRYPYFVLSILQAQEAFMPSNLTMSSYGHCHFVIILAMMLKAGIKKDDSEIEVCLTFCSHFAYFLKRNFEPSYAASDPDFITFVDAYRKTRVIDSRVIEILRDSSYGVIRDGAFRTPYMYYYFLGRYLSQNYALPEVEGMVLGMADCSHVRDNAFALMALVHHSTDMHVIDEVTIRTMCIMDHVPPAKLTPDETSAMRHLVKEIPKHLRREGSVEEERELQRDAEDEADELDASIDEELRGDENHPLNDLYRVFRSTDILAQILKNKYGGIEIPKIEEIVEAIVDASLRSLRLILLDEDQIGELSKHVSSGDPELNEYDVARVLVRLMTLATIAILTRIAMALNKRELRAVIGKVLSRNPTPARRMVELLYLVAYDQESRRKRCQSNRPADSRSGR